MSSPASSLLSQDPGLIGLLLGLGGVAGGFGTPSSSSTNFSNSSTTNSNYNNFLNSLLNSLQNTSSATNTQGASSGVGTTDVTNAAKTVTGTNFNPATQALLAKLTQSYTGLSNPNLSGYQSQQLQQIGQQGNLAQQAAQQVMANRGLSTSPVSATTAAGIAQNTGNQMNQFNESIPLLQNQYALQNLGAASGFLQGLPSLLGTTTGTTGSQQGQSTQNNNTVGQTTNVGQTTGQTTSGQTGGGTSWGATSSSGSQNTKSSQGGGIGGIAGGIGGVLAGLLPIISDKHLKDNISPLPHEVSAARLMKLKPSSWNWKHDGSHGTGVVAQDVERHFPELVHEHPTTGVKMVDYGGLVGHMLSALQHVNKLGGKMKMPAGEAA
jgi:hypothetical protein